MAGYFRPLFGLPDEALLVFIWAEDRRANGGGMVGWWDDGDDERRPLT